MATQGRVPVTSWLALLLIALPVTPFSTCLDCAKNFKFFNCKSNLSLAQKYNLALLNFNGTTENLLSLQCNYQATHLNLTFHKGCNFSSVQYVKLTHCPLFNVPFSEVFAEMGILPEKVVGVTFNNQAVRTDLKLETWHLDGLPNLELLELQRTKLTAIPPDLLQNVPKLKRFLISEVSMSTLPETLFANASNIKSIHLNSRFMNLPDNLFSNIPTLTGLTVYGTQLTELNPKLLSSIPKVTELNLSYNKITKITSDTFLNLPKLKILRLRSNQLESLPGDIFHNCPALKTVHLQRNKIQILPSQLFNKSKMIQDLDFAENKITEIPKGLFQGLVNLTTLSLTKNSIEKIPEGSFADLINLEELSLQDNPLKTLPPGTFDNQHKLKILKLSNTSLSDLPNNIFKTCKSLEEIDLSDNHLSELQSTVFPHPVTVLRILDLGNNNLSFSAFTSEPETREATDEVLLERFPFSDQVGITTLILKSNKIRAMPHALRNLENLQNLDLSDNRIAYLDYHDFIWSPDHANLDSSNVSNTQDLNSGFPKDVAEVKLGGNPLICDCNLYMFSKLLQESISEEEKNLVQLQVVDSTKVKCSPLDDHSNQQQVMTLNINKLFCYQKKCHPSCSCSIRPHDNMFIMDCASQGFQTIPKLKPYLPKGNYSITLNVKNNSIASLKGLQSPSYDTLVNLTISDNHLKVINESYLPKMLQVLDVSNNALTNFCPSVISFLNATDAYLSLSGNPWVCDCQLVDLQTFLRDPKRKVCQESNSS